MKKCLLCVIIFAIAFSLILAGCIKTTEQERSCGWVTEGGDYGRTCGVPQACAPNPNNIGMRIVFDPKLAEKGSQLLEYMLNLDTIILADDLMLVRGENAGFVTCVSVNDQKVVWRKELNTKKEGVGLPKITTSLSVHNGKIYFGNKEGGLNCWNLETGDELFFLKTGTIFDSISLNNGYAYFLTDESLCCVDAENQKEIWNKKLESYLAKDYARSYEINYVVTEDKVFLACYSKLLCINRFNGELLTTVDIQQTEVKIFGRMQDTFMSGLCYYKGKVFVRDGKNVTCFDPIKLETVWSSKCPKNHYNNTIAIYNDVAVAMGKNNNLTGIDINTGEILWTSDAQISVTDRTPYSWIATEKYVFVRYEDYHTEGRKFDYGIVVLDVRNGREIRRFGTGTLEPIFSGISISNGQIYVYTGIMFCSFYDTGTRTTEVKFSTRRGKNNAKENQKKPGQLNKTLFNLVFGVAALIFFACVYFLLRILGKRPKKSRKTK